MELELGIILEPVAGHPKQRLRVFGESGGTIGRSPDNYWELPDPGGYVSGHHCDITFHDGAYWVHDTSRNGVFLNGSQRPLGFGSKARLADGDVLRFATYKVRARLRRRGAHALLSVVKEADYFPPRVLVEPGLLSVPGLQSMPGDPIATTDPSPNLEAPSQTDDRPAPQNPEPSSICKASVSVAAPTNLQPAEVMESTGEHQHVHSADDERTSDEIVEPATPPRTDPAPDAGIATRVLATAFVDAALSRVVHIDRARLQAEGHLPPQSLERLVANQFRHIKRPLIKNAFGKGTEPIPNGNLVMVTSSLPGEGKTFSSINLAFSLAREKDHDVVLIDADVARRHLSRIFGLQEAAGLLDALVDDSIDIESLILPTDVNGLGILPAGQHKNDDVATELLASARMDEIIARLGGRRGYRIALFDSPPLLLTNESRVLASLMGQILLVVRAGVTPQQAVLEAIGYIEEDKPLGLVLNRAKSHVPGSYYGYGSYGYAAYGADESDVGRAAQGAGGKKA